MMMTIAGGLALAFSVLALTIVFIFALTIVFIEFGGAYKRSSSDSDVDEKC
jgi:hypothetical protein